MARFKKGILGGVSGKVGNVVGGNWKGVDYLRSLPTEVQQANTILQQSQRLKFKTVIEFLRPMKELIRLGYKAEAGRMSAFNAAMSYNYYRALTGDFDSGFAIDYSLAVVALGELPGIEGLTVESTEVARLSLGWNDNAADAGAAATDILYVAVYNPAKASAVVRLNLAQRSAAAAEIVLPANYSGDSVHVYAGFIAAEVLVSTPSRLTVAESLYAGPVVVT